MIMLDLGCGPNKNQGFTGIDRWEFDGVDIVRDLRRGLPFADSSIDGIMAKHILEHFDGEDLIFIVDEMWRVCKHEMKVYVEVPALGSPNCGKDYTHKKKDWDEWSFQMWEKKDGEYIIERGPMYGISGEFKTEYQRNPETENAHYQLTTIKEKVVDL
jgi:predicted SAM-dependent methyltransferase